MHRTVPIARLNDILNSERGLTQEEVDVENIIKQGYL